jgi:hypothetical protein
MDALPSWRMDTYTGLLNACTEAYSGQLVTLLKFENPEPLKPKTRKRKLENAKTQPPGKHAKKNPLQTTNKTPQMVTGDGSICWNIAVKMMKIVDWIKIHRVDRTFSL